MTRPRIRKLAVLVGTTALLGGTVAGCGSSSSSGSTSNGTATTAQAGQDGGGPGGMMSTATLKTLAAKLGVSTSALQKAMQSARPSGGGQPGADGASSAAPSSTSQTDPQTQMAAAIAESLDLSESKVAAALKAVMPSAPSGGGDGAPPQASGTATTSSS